VMKVISFLQTPFAVRSGGHSPNPDFSSIGSNGVLISTSNLNAITVSPDNSVASIGPGQRWGAVYEALDPYGVSVVGGRIPEVGVAGLILGGNSKIL
jgi:FAD/FMN-containing dehydrogenase